MGNNEDPKVITQLEYNLNRDKMAQQVMPADSPDQENSYRIMWEMDIDAATAEAAAQQALAGIISGVARVFEVHQWKEPEMITADPITMVDLTKPDHPEHIWVPDQRTFTDQYMGPGLV